MGWQDQSTPLGGAPAASSSGSDSDAPGFFSVENQLGPFAPLFGYKQRHPVDTPTQVLQHAADVGRVAADQVPYLGKAFDVEGAQNRLKGTAYEGAGEALGMAGIGEGAEALGAGRWLAGKIAPTTGDFLANLTAGAAEQGGISAAGEAGHGGSAGDIVRSGLTGAVTGAVTGPGGGPKAKPVTPSTADLERLSTNAWKTAEATPVNNQAVANELGWAKQALTPGERVAISPSLNRAINKSGLQALKGGPMTADDAAKMQHALFDAARNEVGAIRSTADQRLASKFSGAIDTALGPAKSVVDRANAATNVFKTGSDIDNWLANPAIAPKAIKGALAKDPDLYKTQPGLFEHLSDIGKKATEDLTPAQAAGQAVAKHIAGAAVGGAAGYITGGGPLADTAGVALGAFSPRVLSRIQSNRIANRLQVAKHLNATGVKLNPGDFSQTPGWLTAASDAVRQAGYGIGGSGRMP